MFFRTNLERLLRTADRTELAGRALHAVSTWQYVCQVGDVCLNLPTPPNLSPCHPHKRLHQGRTHREYPLVCYPPILSITEWQEAKLVGCCRRSCLLIRCFRQGSDHCGYYSSPPPTAAKCGKDNPTSPRPPPSGAGKFSPVVFTQEMSQSGPGTAGQI